MGKRRSTISILAQALVTILYISLPVLVALVIIGAVGQSIRGSRKPFEEEMRSLLGKIREGQKETNPLLRQHLAEEESDSE